MNKTVVASVVYIFMLILISLLVVALSQPIHEKHLEGEQAIQHDKIFTTYFQTGIPFGITEIKGITRAEVNHMFDVRDLLVWASIITLVLGFILLFLWERIEERIILFLSPLLFAWTALPTILVSNFDTAFEVFHKVLFPQGNYTFPMNSVLITTYPAEFFMQMGLCIAGLYLSISIGLLLFKVISDKIYSFIYRL